MAQNFTSDVYAAGHIGATDLQNMENNFLALQSTFSGNNAPASPVASQLWVDTTNNLLKIRNAANTAWIILYDIGNDTVPDGSVDADSIDALAVTEGKIGALAVTEGKIGALAVTEGKIGTGAVTNAKIGAGAVDAGNLEKYSVAVFSHLCGKSGEYDTWTSTGDEAYRFPLYIPANAEKLVAIVDGITMSSINWKALLDVNGTNSSWSSEWAQSGVRALRMTGEVNVSGMSGLVWGRIETDSDSGVPSEFRIYGFSVLVSY